MIFGQSNVAFSILCTFTTADGSDQKALLRAAFEAAFGPPFLWLIVLGVIALAAVGIAAYTLLRLRSMERAEATENSATKTMIPRVNGFPAQDAENMDLTQSKEDLDKQIKALSNTLHNKLSNAKEKEEAERVRLQEDQRNLQRELEQLRKDMRNLPTPEYVEKELSRRASEQQAQLSHTLNGYAAATTLEQMRGDLGRLRNDTKSATEDLAKRIGAKTLEADFETWKRMNLSTLAAAQAASCRKEFSEESGAELNAAREQLSKLSNRVRALTEAVESSAKDFAVLEVEIDGWQIPALRFSEFRQDVQRFRDVVDGLLDKSDLDRIGTATITTLSFTDVVTGKSAEYFRDDYSRKLSSTLKTVTEGAEQGVKQWQGIRTDLLGVLDVVYPATLFANFSKGESAVQSFLKKLNEQRVQEIEVREGAASYDPTLHESISGERDVRPDLPENTVLRLLRRGYYVDSKVQRRALVNLSSQGIKKGNEIAIRETA